MCNITTMLHELSHSFLSIFCHQDPAICWQHGGLEVLCPRCIGMHAGFLITLVLLGQSGKPASLVLAVAVLCVAVLEWCLAHAGLWQSTNVSRLVTGSATGWAVGSLCRAYLKDQLLVRLSSAAIVLYGIVCSGHTWACVPRSPLYCTARCGIPIHRLSYFRQSRGRAS